VTSSAPQQAEHRHYIMTPSGRTAVVNWRSESARETHYLHADHLGTLAAVTDSGGNVVQRFSYDPWGKDRNVDWSPSPKTAFPWKVDALPGLSTRPAATTRGFTDHEMLDDFGLVHMNGRLYDPHLGRFVSPDPFLDGLHATQAWDRYAYVGNNPLSYTDPSGHFIAELTAAAVAIWQTYKAYYVVIHISYAAFRGYQAVGP
jgi:RHS repeat-associated protein